MSCRAWEERLALYAGGDLDSPEQAETERHLAGCAACRDFAHGMRECLEAMRQAQGEEIAPAHFAAVRVRVLERLRATPRRAPEWRWIAAACAVAALAFFAALWAPRPDRPELPPPHVALAHPPAPPLPAMVAARAPRTVHHSRRPARHSDPLLIRIETDNPDVVIYWIAN